MLIKAICLALLSGAAAAKYLFCAYLLEGGTIQFTEDVRGPASINLSEVFVEGTAEVAIFRNINRANGLKITDEMSKEGYCSQKIRRIVQEEGYGEFFSFHKSPPQMIHDEQVSGLYVVLFANCNYRGSAQVCGRVAFQSKHGYLPSWVFDFLWCTYITAGFYLGAVLLTLQRYCLLHSGNRLLIDKIIVAVLSLGLTEMVLILAHYFMYNRNGTEQDPFKVLADLFGCIKTGTGRALLLVAAFGGGLVRDFIVPTNFITCLCTFYTLSMVTRVILRYWVPHDNFSLFYNILCGILDAYFILWSILAVTRAIRCLEVSDDKARAKRFVHLRRLIILLPLAGLVPLKRVFLVEDDISKAEYIISVVQRAFFLFMVLFLQWFLSSMPAQHRSRLRVELPNIIPAFHSKAVARNRPIQVRQSGTFLAADLDSYGVDDDEEAPIRTVATYDDDGDKDADENRLLKFKGDVIA